MSYLIANSIKTVLPVVWVWFGAEQDRERGDGLSVEVRGRARTCRPLYQDKNIAAMSPS
jgi:hypothetical protein